ncbi:MAG TPA: NnrS family protein [Vicinamibacteria bacterium]
MASSPHGAPTDPYRLFFPLGILLGVAGVSIWLTYYLGLTAGYSGRAHASIQAEGFLYAFIAGFLLTAIPRFTGTDPPGRAAQYALAALLVAATAAFELQAFAAGHLAFLAAHATVVALAARRFLRRRSEPPDTFALVGAGMLTGMLAAAINAAVALEAIDPRWDTLGRRLLTEGMVLLLVLGVGGFLGPRLLGFAAMPLIRVGVPTTPKRRTALHAAAGLALVVLLVLEYGSGLAPLAYARAAVVTAVLLATVTPWRRPAVPSTLAWCVWTAVWLVIAGSWLAAAAPAYRTDLLHVVFMGGFTLLILAVGTRVTLSHGGHSLEAERRSWPLRIGIVTGLVAMLARVGAALQPQSFFEHLALASALWIAGMVLWGVYLLRLIRATRA